MNGEIILLTGKKNMEIFNGPEIIIQNHTDKELFEKLSDLNNLKNIMPEEIDHFEVNKDNCKIKMQNMPELKLAISERTPYSKITLSTIESPLNFRLHCFITPKENSCQARLEVHAEINMMMRMMVQKPINNLLNMLSQKMQHL